MRIGILGAGNVGGALGKQWAASGHEVCFGVRDAQSYTVEVLMNQIRGEAHLDTMRGAATFGEVVVLAVPWMAVPEVLGQAGDLAGKILIDCTNRTGSAAGGAAASGAQEVAHLAPGARVVKAFNTLGAENLADLHYGPVRPATFICGDDPDARDVVRDLGEAIGFDVIDAGLLSTAPLIESLAQLWVHLSRRMGREIAFALLQRPGRR